MEAGRIVGSTPSVDLRRVTRILLHAPRGRADNGGMRRVVAWIMGHWSERRPETRGEVLLWGGALIPLWFAGIFFFDLIGVWGDGTLALSIAAPFVSVALIAACIGVRAMWEALARRVAPFDEKKAGDLGADAREQRERLWHWQAASVGICVSLPLYVFLWQPIQQSDFGEPRFHAGLIFLPLLAFGAQAALQGAITSYHKAPSRLVVSAVALPLTMVAVWSVAFRPMHADFNKASQAFDSFAQRVPAGDLHDRFVDFHEGSRVVICAKQGPASRDRWHASCIGVDTDAAAHDRVYGGYRLASNRTSVGEDTDASGDPYYSEEPEPYDCFGAIGCAK